MTVAPLRKLLDPADPVANVYWFTHAGGGTSVLLQRLREAEITPPVRVFSPWMPYREKMVRASFDGDLNDLARELRLQMLESQEMDALPTVLVGHSFGGAIAFRLAIELIECGLRPHRLIVMATPSPNSARNHEVLHRLSDADLIAEVDRLFGGVPSEILRNPDLQRLFAPALRCDLRLLETHHESASPIDVPLTAVYGSEDSQVGISQVQGWREWTTSQFRLRSMPGNHFFPQHRLAEIVQLGVWDVLTG